MNSYHSIISINIYQLLRHTLYTNEDIFHPMSPLKSNIIILIQVMKDLESLTVIVVLNTTVSLTLPALHV